MPTSTEAHARQGASQARTVVCSPHFDDAVLSCWSVLDRDPDCAVVNVFTGAPQAGFTAWFDQLNGAATSAALMDERVLEDRHALSLAGKAPINLGLLEMQYRLRQSRLLHAAFRHVRPLRFVLLRIPVLRRALNAVAPPHPAQLADAIVQAVPGATHVCAPAGIGSHPDHVLVREAAAVLASRGLSVRLYADMPYSVRYRWPAWIGPDKRERTVDRASAYWLSALESLGLDDPMERAAIVRLTPEERARKAIAVQRYATQVDILNSGQALGWIEKGGLDYEVYWQLPRRQEKSSLAAAGRRAAGVTPKQDALIR